MNILNVLAKEGVLLNVSVHFWRAHKKLQAQDLGLDPDDITDRLISLGHKKLIPSDALKNLALIESRAHAIVAASTFPFLGGIAHYLPNAKLPEVVTRLEGLENEFRNEQASFINRYAELRTDAIREWLAAARKLVIDPDQLVATIESSFPQVEELDRYFGFETHMFQVSVPQGTAQLELITAADQRAVIRARNMAAGEAAEKIRLGAEDFVADCVATLRQETATLCDEMLQSMTSGKTKGVHQKTLNRLIRFVDEFKQMNFAGDSDMEEQLEHIRSEFLSRTAEEYRDNKLAQSKLKAGLGKLRDTAKTMAKQDSSDIVASFGQLGVRRFNLAA